MYLTPEQQRAVDEQILADRKINAIKVYREATNVGLAEAKAAVEAREVQLKLGHAGAMAVPRSDGSAAAEAAAPGPANMAAVDAEIRAGRKIQAIKSYREATGVGLAEAKAAVEAREVQLGVSAATGAAGTNQRTRGCLGVVVIGVGMAVAGTVMAWRVARGW